MIELYKKGKEIKISKIKSKLARKNGLKKHPRLCDILNVVPIEYRKKLQPYLKNKPVRSASGIVIVAVMSKPHRCPHIATTGNICIYCPGGPDSDFEYSTQSYTGYEPTSMRAIRARYNPYIQTKGRIKQLKSIGHDADKIEFVIMGGTFMSLSTSYRDYFIRNLHDALSGHISHNVAEAVKYSAESQTKCIGITIETRPDYCKKRHLKDMLNYGCTRLEVGVQSIYEDIARDTNRGHTIESVKESFKFAKDCGFKIVAHMMPDLPNSGVERDLECFREYFQNPDFRTDGLKLYPTMVIRGTGLYEMWKNKKYRNYQPEALVEIVAKILAKVPPWVRVYRI